MTYTPSSSMRLATATAWRAPSSPGNMTATMGWLPGSRLKSAWSMRSRNRAARWARSARAWSASRAISRARREPPTTAGATVLENR